LGHYSPAKRPEKACQKSPELDAQLLQELMAGAGTVSGEGQERPLNRDGMRPSADQINHKKLDNVVMRNTNFRRVAVLHLE